MNPELRERIRKVLRTLEEHRLFVVQGNIKGLMKEDLQLFLDSKSTIAKSGMDPSSWAENELVKIIEEEYPLSQDEIDRMVARRGGR